jgi:hypothetical protein
MQKAKIDIQPQNTRSYTLMAFHALNGQTGSIVKTNEIEGLKTERVLIKFDKPIDGFYKHGTKHTYFWFNKEDVKILSEKEPS